jgi:hypothetical protein
MVLIAGSGGSAEALFAPKREETNAQRKQRIPKQGHLRGPMSPN